MTPAKRTGQQLYSEVGRIGCSPAFKISLMGAHIQGKYGVPLQSTSIDLE